MSDEAYPDALPSGHRLHWYVLESVLGQGGFGITYLARDTNLDRRVAIKEYLPTDYARRHADATVQARTESNSERYSWGLERFSLEARTLARFDHPSIVRVHSVFEANNTAYMVMRFEDGENLAHLLERCVTLPERQLVPCLLAILDGLQLVHDAGFIHRDIKPENIYVREDGTPVLLDFGSARQSLGRAKTMTILVAPGYAPLEQYYGDSATQGPWTDIYGLGATCYRAVAGHAPLDAIARAKGVLGSAREMLQPAVEIGRGRYDERLLVAIDRALRLSERDRPQSIAEWRNEIVAQATTPPEPSELMPPPSPLAPPPPLTLVQPARALPQKAEKALGSQSTSWVRRAPFLWGAVAAAGAVAATTVFVLPARKAPQRELQSVPAPAPRGNPLPPFPQPPSPHLVTLSPAGPEVPPHAESKVAAAPVPDQPSTHPAKRDAITQATASPAPKSAVPAPRLPATPTKPFPLAQPGPSSTETVTLAPAPDAAPPTPVTVAVINPSPEPTSVPQHTGPSRTARDEFLDTVDAALRRGDYASAVEKLEPLALAGVARSQTMLGRAYEGRGGSQASYFQAYVWYGIAARRGESGAAAMKDKVAGKLQPAEIVQADKVVERWKPSADNSTGSTH